MIVSHCPCCGQRWHVELGRQAGKTYFARLIAEANNRTAHVPSAISAWESPLLSAVGFRLTDVMDAVGSTSVYGLSPLQNAWSHARGLDGPRLLPHHWSDGTSSWQGSYIPREDWAAKIEEVESRQPSFLEMLKQMTVVNSPYSWANAPIQSMEMARGIEARAASWEKKLKKPVLDPLFDLHDDKEVGTDEQGENQDFNWLDDPQEPNQ